MNTLFIFKSPTSQLFELIRKDVLSLAAETFPAHLQNIEKALSPAFKVLRRDMQCWIPMLQHSLLDEEDMYSLIMENKQRYSVNLPDSNETDPLIAENFVDAACQIICTTIISSYQFIRRGNNILSLFYSFCISKNRWYRPGSKTWLSVRGDQVSLIR